MTTGYEPPPDDPEQNPPGFHADPDLDVALDVDEAARLVDLLRHVVAVVTRAGRRPR